eukprot:TRINITY_DN1712_c0_g1_i1.p1 TRINITY_DN1712_c0_g1~~TRINITY_DN1712_c0_g1_i1.p1  ORF type:complete len:1070 (-),score=343.78 TRINITY_DN1712_c0_g1_i1:1264-4473(-)
MVQYDLSSSLMRDTSHLILETRHGEVLIISSLSTRCDTQLISIHPSCGDLSVECFESPTVVLQVLEDRGFKIKTKLEVKQILGYNVDRTTALLLVASKVKKQAILPGGHIVWGVSESHCIRIPLQAPSYVSRADLDSTPRGSPGSPSLRSPLGHQGGRGSPKQKSPRDAVYKTSLDAIAEYPLDGLHYYCETFDITRPFPSSHSVQDYSPEFCWNGFLRRDFVKKGMSPFCAILLQGSVQSTTVFSTETRNSGISTSTSSSSWTESSKKVEMTLFIRRSNLHPGTLLHAQGLNDGGGVANETEFELFFHTCHDTKIDWRSFVWRTGSVPIWWASTRGIEASDSQFLIRENSWEGAEKYWNSLLNRYGEKPVVVCNLLRKSTENSLYEAFLASIPRVQKTMSIDIEVINTDVLGIMKSEGVENCVKHVWESIFPAINTHGFNHGSFQLVEPHCWKLEDGYFQLGRYWHQNLDLNCPTIRFVCLDGLHKSISASFFLSLFVTRHLVMSLTRFDEDFPQFPRVSTVSSWLLEKNLLNPLAQLFLAGGDIMSIIYANSLGHHAPIIKEIVPSAPTEPLNSILAIQKKYQAAFGNKIRQTQVKSFMIDDHAKETTVPSMTTGGAWILQQVPSLFSHVPTDALLHDRDNFSWICPLSCDSAQVLIYLSEPCYVTEISLTISHGNDDSTTPFFFDLFVGPYVDRTTIVYQDVAIPRCPTDTRLSYRVPTTVAQGYVVDTIPNYDFDISTQNPNMRNFAGISPFQVENIYDDVPTTVKNSSGSSDEWENSNSYFQVEKTNLRGSVNNSPQSFGGKNYRVSALGRVVKIVFKGLTLNSALSLGKIEIFGAVRRAYGVGAEPEKFYEQYVLKQAQFVANAFSGIPKKPEPQIRKSSGTILPESENTTSLTPRETLYFKKVKDTIELTDGLNLLDVLELELTRLENFISAQRRDEILLLLNQQIPNFNPDSYIYFRDERTEASLRKSKKYKTGKCASCGETRTSLGLGLLGHKQCAYCYKRYCTNCMAPQPIRILEFQWDKPQVTCKSCHAILSQHISLLQKIQLMAGTFKLKVQVENRI